MAESLNKVTDTDIDDILKEIDKTSAPLIEQSTTEAVVVDWDEIIKHMQNGEVNYIKNLITSFKININSQNPSNGMTLLMYAVVID